MSDAGVTVFVIPRFADENLARRMPKEEQNILDFGACAGPGNVPPGTLAVKAGWLLANPDVVRKHGGNLAEALNDDFVGEIPGPQESIR